MNNDWWSNLIKEVHVGNLFNYPFTMRTISQGLVVSYIPWGVIGDLIPVPVGETGMKAARSTVSGYSDWTVTLNWNDGAHHFNATSGIGMPFIYFTKDSSDVVQIIGFKRTTCRFYQVRLKMKNEFLSHSLDRIAIRLFFQV